MVILLSTGNNFNTLEEDSVENLPSLTVVEMSQSLFDQTTKLSFRNLTNLKQITVDGGDTSQVISYIDRIECGNLSYKIKSNSILFYAEKKHPSSISVLSSRKAQEEQPNCLGIYRVVFQEISTCRPLWENRDSSGYTVQHLELEGQ